MKVSGRYYNCDVVTRKFSSIYTNFNIVLDILLGFESPLGITTPSRSRSRSPIKQSDGKEGLTEEDGEEQQSCECHACTLPPVRSKLSLPYLLFF